MGSVTRRVGAGFTVLMVLFSALVLLQLLVGDRMQQRQQAHADRIELALAANSAVLQNMTDAETGVRGFQLTGDKDFLSPYDSGRVGAFVAFDQLTALSADPVVLARLTTQRQAAVHWLYAYGIPIVNAGVADADDARASRGRQLFDLVRTANAAVDAAIRAEQHRVVTADRRHAREAQLLFGGLAVAFLAVAIALALVHQRHLLAPLDNIRQTLTRLARGEHSARATVTGHEEMRRVIGTLNDLAAETERLLAAEQARAVRNELRQAVAGAFRSGDDLAVTGGRIAELIGTALHADVVSGRITLESGDVLISRPAGAEPPGDGSGTVSLSIDGGRLAVARGAEWTTEERRLLSGLAREIEYAVGQRRLAESQARLIGELRTLDERKDAFVATVTHELRTPLTSILGYVEMLADGDGGPMSDLQQRGVSAIARNALRLQETVGDLLLLDRSNGRVGLAPEPVELAGVLSEVQAQLDAAAQAKDVTLTVDARPVWVTGDRAHLQRAIRNLVENAVKFTGAGGTVTCRLGPDAGSVVFAVTDTGIGIPADDVPGLFTPFHRGTNAMHQAVQGSGLGLAIVHNIVTEHGGIVRASSSVDEGSTFTVTLPGVPAPVPSLAQ
jgi:two-component system phosphate regulon sensor histidine kinase PhoR